MKIKEGNHKTKKKPIQIHRWSHPIVEPYGWPRWYANLEIVPSLGSEQFCTPMVIRWSPFSRITPITISPFPPHRHSPSPLPYSWCLLPHPFLLHKKISFFFLFFFFCNFYIFIDKYTLIKKIWNLFSRTIYNLKLLPKFQKKLNIHFSRLKWKFLIV